MISQEIAIFTNHVIINHEILECLPYPKLDKS
jgi:hypothetical protein